MVGTASAAEGGPLFESQKGNVQRGMFDSVESTKSTCPPAPESLEVAAALAMAVRCLSRREYAAKELFSRLIRGGHSESDAQMAIQHCQLRDWQNDARMAATFIRSHLQRGHGPLWVKRDLQQRGVALALVDELMQCHAKEWTQVAVQQIRRKGGAVNIASRRAPRQMLQMLCRRGFTLSQARIAWDVVQREQDKE